MNKYYINKKLIRKLRRCWLVVSVRWDFNIDGGWKAFNRNVYTLLLYMNMGE
jgi:hypothetical protein